MTPVALQKAESLALFAKSQGSPLSDFALTLTLGEAYELLDFLAEGGLGRFLHHDRLVQDIADAKVDSNPWAVLTHFQLQGFEILRADLVLN